MSFSKTFRCSMLESPAPGTTHVRLTEVVDATSTAGASIALAFDDPNAASDFVIGAYYDMTLSQSSQPSQAAGAVGTTAATAQPGEQGPSTPPAA